MSARKSAVAARSPPALVLRLCFRGWSSRCEREYLLIAELQWPGAGLGGHGSRGRIHCRMHIFGERRAMQSGDLDALRDLSGGSVTQGSGAALGDAGARLTERMRGTDS